ncbi:hypothetical protein AB6O49_11000 [Streptomyces sp. SBR177]
MGGVARAMDLVAALSAFGLMVLDVPGLARADNSLTGVTATLVLAAGAATLVLRRRAPWVPFAVALVLMGWLHELTMIQFALYSLGRFRGRRTAVLATLLYVAAAYAYFQTPGWPARHGEALSDFLSLVVPIGVLAAGVGIAAYRHDLVRALEAERREAAARQAVQEERISVGRDVHDLVGRELTVLAVRAEVLAARAGRDAGERRTGRTSRSSPTPHGGPTGRSTRPSCGAPTSAPRPGSTDSPRSPRRAGGSAARCTWRSPRRRRPCRRCARRPSTGWSASA